VFVGVPQTTLLRRRGEQNLQLHFHVESWLVGSFAQQQLPASRTAAIAIIMRWPRGPAPEKLCG